MPTLTHERVIETIESAGMYPTDPNLPPTATLIILHETDCVQVGIDYAGPPVETVLETRIDEWGVRVPAPSATAFRTDDGIVLLRDPFEAWLRGSASNYPRPPEHMQLYARDRAGVSGLPPEERTAWFAANYPEYTRAYVEWFDNGCMYDWGNVQQSRLPLVWRRNAEAGALTCARRDDGTPLDSNVAYLEGWAPDACNCVECCTLRSVASADERRPPHMQRVWVNPDAWWLSDWANYLARTADATAPVPTPEHEPPVQWDRFRMCNEYEHATAAEQEMGRSDIPVSPTIAYMLGWRIPYIGVGACNCYSCMVNNRPFAMLPESPPTVPWMFACHWPMWVEEDVPTPWDQDPNRAYRFTQADAERERERAQEEEEEEDPPEDDDDEARSDDIPWQDAPSEPRFHKGVACDRNPSTRFLGCEVELAGHSDGDPLRTFLRTWQGTSIVGDGSLPDGGFELVTPPHAVTSS